MNLLWLILFFQTTNSTLHNFTDLSIDISTVSSGNVGNTSTTDTCNKLIIRNFQVYHLSNTAIYNGWLKNSLTSPTSNINLALLFKTVQDFDVSSDQAQLVFYTTSLLGLSNSKSLYAISSQYSVSSVSSISQSSVPAQLFIMGNNTIDFYGSSTSFLQPTIQKRDKSTNNVVGSVNASSSYLKMAVSPDYVIGVTWTSQTSCLFYNLSSLTQIGSYKPVSTPIAGATNSITFSKDSQYAVIETDNYNPIVVINLNNLTVAYSITVIDTIKQAYFLDSSSTILVVHGNAGLVFVNLTSNKQYSTPAMAGTIFGADQHNNIFTCFNNVISQNTITFSPLINSTSNTSSTNTSNSNTSTNSNTSSNSNTSNTNTSNTNTSNSNSMSSNTSNQSYTDTNSTNQTQNLNIDPFSRPINFDDVEKQIAMKINQTLQTVTQIANYFANFAASTPVSIYFLGFLNFITTSTLYVLLNFPIPEHIYHYLAALYNNVNIDLLNTLGISYSLPQLSDQKVTSPRALRFGITSDILVGNAYNMAICTLSIILICLFNLLAVKFMNRGSLIRKCLVEQKPNMIQGQIIGLMQPFMLPWSFILLSFGQRKAQNKLNSTAYILFFMLFTLFSFYYPLALIQRSKNNSIQPLIKTDKVQTFRLEWIKQSRFILTNKPKFKAKSLLNLINIQIIQNWYLCFTNLIFPILVLLQNPSIFLIIIFGYDILGILIATKKTECRINSVCLSIYPFMVHSCFMIFYWCSSDYVVSITEIICLIALLIGIVHNMLTLVVQILLGLKTVIVNCCKKNRVAHHSQSRKEQKKVGKKNKQNYPNIVLTLVSNKTAHQNKINFRQHSSMQLQTHNYGKQAKTARQQRTKEVKPAKKARKFKYLVISS